MQPFQDQIFFWANNFFGHYKCWSIFLCFYLQNHAPSPVTNKFWPYGYFEVNKRRQQIDLKGFTQNNEKKTFITYPYFYHC